MNLNTEELDGWPPVLDDTIYLSADPMNDTSNISTEIPNYSDVIPKNDTLYFTILPILPLTCFIAMVVNVLVIASARWIRCSMTPNLKMSLSLAAADAASSTLCGLLYLFENYQLRLGAFGYVLEVLRLSGIVVTVVHLLALSLNHYIGILKPLHYNSIVTDKKVYRVLWLLWLVPFLVIVCLLAAFDTNGTLRDNFLNNSDQFPKFMDTFSFRISYSVLFFLPIFFMVICYSHIVIVVKKQQTRWNNLSRVGSTRVKGKAGHKMSRERKQLEGNVKAIYTTLLILGSCFLGWTPALLIFTLTCTYGCYISGEQLDYLNRHYFYTVISLRLVENMLIVLKMLANPIIYSIRVREIKEGTRRMLLVITGIFSESRRRRLEESGFYYRSRLQNSGGGGTIQVRMTSVRNGDGTVKRSGEENTIL